MVNGFLTGMRMLTDWLGPEYRLAADSVRFWILGGQSKEMPECKCKSSILQMYPDIRFNYLWKVGLEV